MESNGTPRRPSFLTLYSYVQPPGFDSRRHVHADFWEMLLITQGSLRVITQGKESQGIAGSIYIRPPGVAHQESCVAKVPVTLWVLSWVTTPHPTDKLAPIETFDSIQQIAGGINWLAHLQRFVGPRHPMLDAVVETLLFVCSLDPHLGKKSRFLTVFDYIQQHLREPLTLTKLARVACMSESHFAHEFRRQTNLSPIAYVRKIRLEYACREVTQTNRLFREIAREIGLRDEFEFSRVFRRIMGVSPNKLRRQLETIVLSKGALPRTVLPAGKIVKKRR